MENLKEVISQNIVSLRKHNKLTQLDLSERISYSDKAISRWEKGESLPDVETLYRLSEIFEVPVEYFFEVHNEPLSKKEGNKNILNKVMVTIFSCAIVWLLALIVYIYLKSYKSIDFWQAFIWGVPFTMLVLGYFDKIWGKNKLAFLTKSIFVWSFICAFYCSFLSYNIWIIYLVGALTQAILIIYQYIKPIRKRKK